MKLKEKVVIIINGVGGIGKVTLCEFAEDNYTTQSVSAITPIKVLAVKAGWDGEKDAKGRKLLSQLKAALTEYNDASFHHLSECISAFKNNNCDILFVHIREPEEIDRFKRYVEKEFIKCITLLVQPSGGMRKVKNIKWNNPSDDNVDKYNYDYCYYNYYFTNHDQKMEAKKYFNLFLEEMLKIELDGDIVKEDQETGDLDYERRTGNGTK